MDDVKRLNAAAVSTADFIKIVQKYTRTKKLSKRMLNEFIERIEVHHAEKIDGKKHQKLTIYYHCIGSIEIPELKNLDVPQTLLKTRKGVAVSYSA